ncbi:triacylglycerol lipase [Vogesella sp. XCS3]|uniref:lipase family alpha/beta hydrolase n=1 Tax=Vogesella sp. XCS3 TaxID=2877939 RepID=UPI001D0AE6A7|nr:triacylglycerol lipase [Vogesella sp. XCS3]UDM17679.1 triacylglycerol lipase [Vogesella sp. XCS3]
MRKFIAAKRILVTAVLVAAGLQPAFGMGTVPADSEATYTKTKYPIVLVHGVLGFDSFLGMDYFYGIPAELQRGGAQVFVAQVSPADSYEKRGEQLLAQVQRIVAMTGSQKVNLIGHSMGSPTSRYVASVRPDLVASVTSVGGVNKGTKVADALRGVLPAGSVAESVAVAAGGAFASLVRMFSTGSSLSQDELATLNSLTTAGTLAFNRRHPQAVPTTACGEGAYQVNGIHYFSWSGAQPYTNPLDAGDPLLAATSLVFGSEPNDGVIATCSSHLGQVIRDNYRFNHLDETNMFFGLGNILETSPVTLFRQHANRLRNIGV